jgi:hypothetical protein
MYVHVMRANGGLTTFQECVADVFTSDELTVTCTAAGFTEQHGPLQVFPSGTWREATVYRDNGFPDYSFQSSARRAELAEFVAASRDPRRA